MSVKENLIEIRSTIPEHVTLVAVSKTKPNHLIEEAYASGQRDFGENKVQELCQKAEILPRDIKWHMIGHLQTNKVKYIAPFVYLIHGVDSLKLLKEINKRAIQNNRIIDCLLQIHIADETTKFGFSANEVIALFESNELKDYSGVNIRGVMGMATNTDHEDQIKKEFTSLKTLFEKLKTYDNKLTTISMGMSGDYQIAIEAGSTMVRVGSSIFGARNYNTVTV